jgi:cytochrome c biogenesis protein CcdA
MKQLVKAFGLGAAAILTNACVLPLYPGLIAFMAGDRQARE